MQGFLFPDRRNNDLYAATHGLTQDRVEAITDTGLLAPRWAIEPIVTAGRVSRTSTPSQVRAGRVPSPGDLVRHSAIDWRGRRFERDGCAISLGSHRAAFSRSIPPAPVPARARSRGVE